MSKHKHFYILKSTGIAIAIIIFIVGIVIGLLLHSVLFSNEKKENSSQKENVQETTTIAITETPMPTNTVVKATAEPTKAIEESNSVVNDLFDNVWTFGDMETKENKLYGTKESVLYPKGLYVYPKRGSNGEEFFMSLKDKQEI